MYRDGFFELAIEATIPEDKKPLLKDPSWETCRYQVRIGQQTPDEPVGIISETLFLKHKENAEPRQQSFFQEFKEAPETICHRTGKVGTKAVVNKVPGGNDNFYDETGAGWDHAFKLGNQKSALANLPEDETKFPVSTWFKRVLLSGIEFLHLDSETMRRPSPPGKGTTFRPDGSNLPWVIRDLREKVPKQFEQWLDHIRTALPDITSVKTVIRSEDRHCYLQVHYASGLKVPSWGLSDGTLRMFALTLLPYLPDLRGVYLIEEPENGIHPRAVETVYESISSVYNAQVLTATHSLSRPVARC